MFFDVLVRVLVRALQKHCFFGAQPLQNMMPVNCSAVNCTHRVSCKSYMDSTLFLRTNCIECFMQLFHGDQSTKISYCLQSLPKNPSQGCPIIQRTPCPRMISCSVSSCSSPSCQLLLLAAMRSTIATSKWFSN